MGKGKIADQKHLKSNLMINLKMNRNLSMMGKLRSQREKRKTVGRRQQKLNLKMFLTRMIYHQEDVVIWLKRKNLFLKSQNEKRKSVDQRFQKMFLNQNLPLMSL